MFAKILLLVMGLAIITFLGCNFTKKNNSLENNTNESSNDQSKNQTENPSQNQPANLPTDLPVIASFKDIDELEEQKAYVLGIYKLKDMRMRKENPDELFKGHAEIVFGDGYSVVLMPPDDKLAIRPQEEQTQFNGKKVYVKGTVYPYIPWGDSNLKSPCLVDIEYIKPAQ